MLRLQTAPTPLPTQLGLTTPVDQRVTKALRVLLSQTPQPHLEKLLSNLTAPTKKLSLTQQVSTLPLSIQLTQPTLLIPPTLLEAVTLLTVLAMPPLTALT